MNFRTACEVGDALAARLGLDPLVRESLAANFERWNGRGLPAGTRGVHIPLPMRIAQLAQELEVLARINGIDDASATIRKRRAKAYDPDLADLTVEHAPHWWAEVETVDPWDAALAVAPHDQPLDPASIHAALLVVADFSDLKSPWLAGHSRGVADLVGAVTGRAFEPAALLHDLGRVGVANPIWDKPAPFTRDERDRAETHSLITEQLLRRTPYTSAFAQTAGAAHERQNASGYHRHASAAQLDEHQRLLATADIYQALISSRPHRAAFTRDDAATELRSMAAAGRLDATTVERVLAAAGHPREARPHGPGGITARETEVLRLVALGLTVRQIADRLVITPKTADHHIQNIYSKIGVSTRGAAALYAIEHGILNS
jgi:HD-GYP domain-containing protein (c-di-GMP phosphodiesterase class II)